ncbi:PDZ domain-containing protein [Calorimonas adulescens]|uniref:PDZ domain-containing protein n=2 Tax=Calorimonas adulescens TaxID=2606906 RepID=A0A5D8QB64_9THEO|nr:PDZ domain-containing protein [Calorimonas adulescens]
MLSPWGLCPPPFKNSGGDIMDNNDDIFKVVDNEVKRKDRFPWTVIIVVAIVSAMLGGLIVTYAVPRNYDSAVAATDVTIPEDSVSDLISSVAEKVSPAVVSVSNMALVNSNFQIKYVEQGSGTGVIFDKNGYIVTNNHVVEGAKRIEVGLTNGKKVVAKLIGTDSKTDLAVLKIDETNLPVATFGDSDKIKVGQLAIAIGNPLGEQYAGTVTAGIISGINRVLNVGDTKLKLIQTDAAINPGNSGGPLVNSKGEVIGITSVKLVSTGGSSNPFDIFGFGTPSGNPVEGMGFAIPINDAKPIINQLIKNGYVERPLMGVAVQEISSDDAKIYNLPVGLYVAQVQPGGPAETAGIMPGDVITAVDGKNVTTLDELQQIIYQHKVGDTITVTVVRNGKSMNMKVKLASSIGS